jgi:hypothetical protein
MPVVAIELDHDSIGDERIDGELTADYVLFHVLEAEKVQHGVSITLESVGPDLLLGCIRGDKVGLIFRVGLAAWDRAVFDIVQLGAGRRPFERVPATLAGVNGFSATLPFVGVRGAAEVIPKSKTMFGDVDRCFAYGALERLAVFLFGFRRSAVAGDRAKPLSGWKVVGYGFAAGGTNDGANLIAEDSFHALIIGAQSNRLC